MLIKIFSDRICVLFYFILLTLIFSDCSKFKISKVNYREIDDFPRINPDYTEITIPPNIAPLNFQVWEEGYSYYIEIYAKQGDKIIIKSNNNTVQIPLKDWRRLLDINKGQYLCIDIFVKDQNGNWIKYKTIRNKIALHKIDSYVVYRLINPCYVLWHDMGIYQRCVENFKETPILTNRVTKRNCMNCHSFCQNNPKKMLWQMRAAFRGMILIDDTIIRKLNTKTNYTMSAFVYPSWHPDGSHIAFSVNKIYQRFHGHTDRNLYVFDTHSDIVIYNIKTNIITTSPQIATDRLENLPNWSPDGKYIYYCSALMKKNMKYNEVKYDLMRIAYDVKTNKWGSPEIVLTSEETGGKSISFPKISPDGNRLLFCISNYGYFTIHFKTSDLFLMDLKNYKYKKLEINSEDTESYHSWSSNSRWFVFVSKNSDGLCSRLYFSYIDESGEIYKSFLMPQKDPEFYNTFNKNYNLPEMITGPVKINTYKLKNVIYSEPVDVVFDDHVDLDALSGASKIER